MSNYLNILGKNTASNFIFFFVSKGLTLASYAILLRYLSLEDYGLLIFAGTVLGQFNFLEGGLSTALEKFIPEYRIKEQFDKINKSIIVTFLFFFIIGLIVSALILLTIYTDIISIFKIQDLDKARTILALSAIFTPFAWGSKSILGALKGYNKYHFLNILDTSAYFFTTIVTIVLAVLGVPVLWIFLSQQVLGLMKGMLLGRTLLSLFKIKVLGISLNDILTTFKEIFSYSLWVFIMNAASSLINQFDKLIISGMIGVNALPIYVGVTKLMKMLTEINNKLKSAVIPIASEINSKFDQHKFNEVAIKGIRAMNALAAPITALAVIFGDPMLRLLGKEHLLPYTWVYQLGAIIYMLAGSRAFLHTMHIGAGTIIKFMGVYSVATSVFYVASAFILTHYFGLTGAILALPFTHAIMYPVWVKVVLAKTNLSFSLFGKAIIQGQWPSWIILILYFTLNSLVVNPNMLLFTLISLVFISLLAYLSWNYTIDSVIKNYIKKRFIKLPHKLSTHR